MNLNRIEKWLVKQAYPEIDWNTVELFLVKRNRITIPFPPNIIFPGTHDRFTKKDYDLREFVFEAYKSADGATYSNYASARFYWDKERNLLVYKAGSLRKGRYLYDFEIAHDEPVILDI